jgi:hypothetical protein
VQQFQSIFYIECGGLDGEDFSNTVDLERKYNWTGVLIEGSPANFDILLKRHRKAALVPACVSLEKKATLVIWLLIFLSIFAHQLNPTGEIFPRLSPGENFQRFFSADQQQTSGSALLSILLHLQSNRQNRNRLVYSGRRGPRDGDNAHDSLGKSQHFGDLNHLENKASKYTEISFFIF